MHADDLTLSTACADLSCKHAHACINTSRGSWCMFLIDLIKLEYMHKPLLISYIPHVLVHHACMHAVYILY